LALYITFKSKPKTMFKVRSLAFKRFPKEIEIVNEL
jgi:hypothetical protein